MSALTRRQMLAGAAGGALAGCGRRRGPAPMVSILRAGSYSEDLFDQIRRLIAEHKLDVRGKRVVLSRTWWSSTQARHQHASGGGGGGAGGFRSAGAAEVRIAEGPGHRRNTLELAEAAGYFHTVPEIRGVVYRSRTSTTYTAFASPRAFESQTLYLPATALGCDLLVSMPKMKCHHWVGATLSMKNLFGLVPGGVYGWPKNVLHWAGITESIADLHACSRTRSRLSMALWAWRATARFKGRRNRPGFWLRAAMQ